ncbi:nucleotidyltransferase [Thermosphaera chiliense]|uniref:Nucleotidyltransferase n=1 Tax=Thermosphaera chiliense TaxID=3402707 RepID=A0A7M1UU69_9CREN|nr:nucleotidyltransferase [Thermosphaera aggregans]QOR94902.1 nucleotidyltransferase [Thermosphaera aggregans]
MGFSVDSLASVLSRLSESGVDYVLIGDTVVQLHLGFKTLEGDVDLFVLAPSPLGEQEFYSSLAEANGWEVASTELGTPKLICAVNGETVEVEFYENFMDLEIPEELLNLSVTLTVGSVRARALRPEHYFVLKARQGVDLDKLKRWLKQVERAGFNKKVVEEAISCFPGYEEKTIRERLRSIGLTV